jgi:hypothetical protein
VCAENGAGIDIDQTVDVGGVTDLGCAVDERASTAESPSDLDENPQTLVSIPNR